MALLLALSVPALVQTTAQRGRDALQILGSLLVAST